RSPPGRSSQVPLFTGSRSTPIGKPIRRGVPGIAALAVSSASRRRRSTGADPHERTSPSGRWPVPENDTGCGGPRLAARTAEPIPRVKTIASAARPMMEYRGLTYRLLSEASTGFRPFSANVQRERCDIIAADAHVGRGRNPEPEDRRRGDLAARARPRGLSPCASQRIPLRRLPPDPQAGRAALGHGHREPLRSTVLRGPPLLPAGDRGELPHPAQDLGRRPPAVP